MAHQRTTVRTRIPGESWDVLVKIGNDDPVHVGTVLYEDRDDDGGNGYIVQVYPGGPTLTDSNGWAFDSKRRAVAEAVAHHHKTR